MAKSAESKANSIMTPQNSVKVAGGKLILSLPTAHTPVVWQMGLDNAQASSFTIAEDKKKGMFVLISKVEGAAADEIATFDSKQAAVDILMMASSALQNNAAFVSSAASVQRQDNSGKIGAVLAFFMLIALVAVWMLSAGSSLDSAAGLSKNGQISSSARDSSGVPVSADEFLNNR